MIRTNKKIRMFQRLSAAVLACLVMVYCVRTAESSYLPVTGSNIGIGTSTPVGALTVMNGNVGIGTWSPTTQLQVIGNVSVTDEVYGGTWDGSTNVPTKNAVYDQVQSLIVGGAGGWTDGGTNVYTSTTTDLVAIGTTTPVSTLTIKGNIGVGTTLPYQTIAAPANGMIVEGNVGIGTWSPRGPLDVFSTIVIGSSAAGGALDFGGFDNNNQIGYGSSQFRFTTNQPLGFNFFTGGALNHRVNFSANGHVGIGTVSPSSRLVVNGGVGIGTLNSSTFINTAAPSGGLIVENNVGIGTTTPVGALAVMNGNVGIGTWSPRAALEVVGSVLATSFVGDGSGLTNVANSSGWTDGGTNVYTSATTDNVGIGTTTPTAALLIENAGTQASLRVNDAVLDGSPFIIDSAGNVGIGTTVPSAHLSVNGTNSSIYLRETSGTGYAVMFLGEITGSQVLTLGRDSSAGGSLITGSSPYAGVLSRDGAYPLQFGTNGVIRMTINDSGNVGIGTTSASVALLNVNGETYIAGPVGIGTFTPTGMMDIRQDEVRIWTGAGTSTNATAAGELYVEGDLEVDGTIYGDGAGLTGVSGITMAGGWTDGGTNVYTTTTTDLVAIGTTTPVSTLTVKGNVGIGTTAPYTTIAAPANGMVVEGNVGIGTFAASSGKLVVMGGNVGIGLAAPTKPLHVTKTFTSVGTNDGVYFDIAGEPSASVATTYKGLTVRMLGGDSTHTTTTYSGIDVTAQPNAGLANIVNGGLFSVYAYDSYPANSIYGIYTWAQNDAAGKASTGGSFNARGSGGGALTGVDSDVYNTGTSQATSIKGVDVSAGTSSDGAASIIYGGYYSVYNSSGVASVNNAYGNYIEMDAGVGITNGYGLYIADIGATNDYGIFQNATNDTNYFAGNIGVGTFIAQSRLVVNGGVGIGTLSTSTFINTTAPSGGLIVEKNVGIGTTTPVGALTVMNGNVGIGTWSPTQRLQVIGTVDATYFVGDGSGLTNVTGANSGWSDGGTNVYTSTTTDNVGIGTTTPTSTLEVVKTAAGTAPLMVSTTAVSDGDLLIVASDGNIGIGTVTPVGAFTVMNGNVGIGTWKPSSDLSVKGVIEVPGATDDAILITDNRARAQAYMSGGGTGNVSFMGINSATKYPVIGSYDHSGSAGFHGIVQTGSFASFYGFTYRNPFTQTVTPAETAMSVNSTYIDFWAGGGNFMTVDYSGNVGIGTGNPGGPTRNAKLDLTSNGTSDGIVIDNIAADGDPTIKFELSNTGILTMGIDDSDSDKFKIGTTAIDTSTRLTIDTGGNVGIGTTSPGVALLNVNGETYIAGPVGIGTFTPTGMMDIRQDEVRIWTGSGTSTNATAAGELYVEGDLEVDGTIYGDGAGLTGVSGLTVAGGWSDGGTNVYTTTTTDNVGIGTTTPTAALLIENAGTQASFRVNDAVLDSTPFIIDSAGNVGIGTTTPIYPLELELTNTATSGSKYLQVNGVTVNPGSTSTAINYGLYSSVGSAGTTISGNYGRLKGIGGQAYLAASPATTPTATTVYGGEFGAYNWGGTITDMTGLYAEATGSGSGGVSANATNMRGIYVFTEPDNPAVVTNLYGIHVYSSTSGGVISNRYGLYLQAENFGTITDDYGIYQAYAPSRNYFAGNIGIGTIKPQNRLAVNGGVGIGTLNASAFLNTSAPDGGLIVEKNVGIGTTTPVGGLTVMNGNVGIGTWSPTQRLQVVGTVSATAFVGDGSGLTNLPSGGGWTDGGTNVYTSTTTDNVGIGTTTPTSTLEIVKTAAGTAPLMVSTTATGDGNIMIVTSSGNVGIGTASPSGALTVMNGNVGIGITNPSQPLYIYSPNGTTGIQIGTPTPSGVFTATPSVLGLFPNAAGSDRFYIANDVNSGVKVLSVDTVTGSSTNSTVEINGILSVLSLTDAPNIVKVMNTMSDTVFSIDTRLGGMVGIGTLDPLNKLVVNGGVAIGTLTSSTFINTLAPSGGLIVEKNVGIGTTTPVGGLTVMNGNVGIGTWSPTQRLQVVGTVAATAFVGDGSGLTGLPAGGGWTDGGTNVYTSITTDNVGIGTTTPNAATLEIVKNAAQPALKISSTATGSGDFLVVNSQGNVGLGTIAPVGALTVMSGNVGIGTWSPTSLFEVVGTGDSSFTTNVGIGTIAPAYALEVIGTGRFSSAVNTPKISNLTTNGFVKTSGGDGTLSVDTGTYTTASMNAGYIQKSTSTTAIGDSSMFQLGNNLGIGTITPVGALTVMSGNVGIGTWSPRAALEVVGSVLATSFYGDGSNLTGISAGNSGWTDGGTNVFTSTTTDLVAIGTTTPISTLTVKGNVGIGTTTPYTTIAAPLNGMIVEGNVGIGTFAASNGKLVVMGGNVGVGTVAPRGALVVMNGNVGIGTTSPLGNFQVLNGMGMFGKNVPVSLLSDDLVASGTGGGTIVVGSPTQGDWGAGSVFFGRDSGPNSGPPGTWQNLFQIFGESGDVSGGDTTRTFTINDSVANKILMRIDAAGNVGVGTEQSPAARLEIVSANTTALMISRSRNDDGNLLKIDSSGNVGIGTTTPVGALAVMSGNVGIGTWVPRQRLEVVGTVQATAFVGDGSGLTGISAGGWTDGGTNVYTSTTTDNVGIGTTTPTAALLVENAGTQASFRVNDAVLDGTPFIIDSAGNVGIGTTTPSAKMDIVSALAAVDPLVLQNSDNSGFTTIVFKDNTGAAQGQLGYANTGSAWNSDTFYFGASTAKNILFVTADLERMRVTSAGNVGVGTYSAQSKFVVNGAVGIGSTSLSSFINASAPAGGLLVEKNVGIGTTTPVGALTVMNGNVGIGTWSPRAALEVVGSVLATSFVGDGSGLTNLPGGSSGWTDGGTNVYTSVTTDNVGIGTTTPNATTLEIVKNAAQPLLKLSSTATGAGDFLTIDSAGNVGISTTNTASAAFAIMNGNVGIGTWKPDNALDIVNGNIGIGTAYGMVEKGTTNNLLSLKADTTSTYVGYKAGNSMVLGSRNNVALGSEALYTSDSGQNNVAIGRQALYLTGSGVSNIAIGRQALYNNDSGSSNIALGTGSLIFLNGVYSDNIAMGSDAGRNTVFLGNVLASSQSIFLGSSTKALASGDTNEIVIGYGAEGSGSNTVTLGNSSVVSTILKGNVGLGTYNPKSRLVVNGGVGIGTLMSSAFINTAAPSGGLIVERNVGIGTTTPVGALTVMNGNVGIGTWSPRAALEVVGSVLATSFVGDGSGLTNLPSGGGWTDGGTNVFTSTTTDNVGIGTTTPNAATLEIVKNAAQPLMKISSTASGSGDYMIVSSDGKVGIGTTLLGVSATSKLSVGGDITLIQSGGLGIKIEAQAPIWSGGDGEDLTVQAAAGSGGNGGDLNLNAGNADSGNVSGNVYITPGGGMGGNISGNVQITGGQSGGTPGGNVLIEGGNGSLDGNVFLAAANGNVSIGTTSPAGLLTIIGNVGIGTTLPYRTIGGSANGLISEGNVGIGTWAANEKLIVMGGNVGIGTLTPVGALTVMNGNVGIGTWSPRARLEVVGSVLATSFVGDGSGLTGISAGGWTDGGTNVYTATTTDTVGIGTTTASGTVEIVKQGSSVPLMVSSTAAGDGDYVTISSNGNVGLGTVAPRAALSVMNGNVGIGTTSPLSAFQVTSTATPQVRIWAPSSGTATLSLFSSSVLDWTVSGDANFTVKRDAIQVLLIDGNANVGIGALTPINKLEVPGAATVGAYAGTVTAPSNGLIVSGNVGIGTMNASNGALIVAGNVGIGTVTPVGAIAVMNGNVGIGTWSPRAALEVVGSVLATSFYGDGSNLTGISAGSTGWTDGGTNVYTTTTTDNVGIGTTTPSSTVEIVKTAAGTAPFMVSTTAAGDGNLLIITSDGNMGIGTTTPVAGLAVMNGNVGIGTWKPVTNLMIVGGGTNASAGLRIQNNITDATNKQGRIKTGHYTNSEEPVTALIANSGPLENRLNIGGSSSFENAATSINFYTASNNTTTTGTQHMVINEAGNVGIGTYTPLSKFAVYGGVVIGTTSSSTFNTAAPSGGLIIEGNVGIGTTTPVGGLAVMNGNTGIGTWSPRARLEVVGSVLATSFVGDGSGLTNLPSGGGWSDGGTNVYTTTTTDNVGIGTTTPTASLLIQNVGTQASLRVNDALLDSSPFIIDAAGNIGIGTSVADSGKLIITGGNVGIGTTSPNYNLDVEGFARATQGLVSDFDLKINYPAQNNTLISVNANTGVTPVEIFQVRANSANGQMTMRESGGVDVVRLDTAGVSFLNGGNVGIGTDMTSAAARLAVLGGNVGIGTITPEGALTVMSGNVGIGSNVPGAKLDVIGTVRATAFVGDGSGLTNVANSSGWTDGGTNVYTSTTTDNVGIGTTTPASTLTVAGNIGIGTYAAYRTIAGPNNGIIAEGNVGIGTWSASSGKLIVTGGNVGIGSTAPSRTLDVVGSARISNGSSSFGINLDSVSPSQVFLNTSTGGYYDTNFGVSTDGTLNFYQNNQAKISIGSTLGNETITMPLSKVGIGTSTPVGALTVMNGNVGIGTWSPVGTLEVKGTGSAQVTLRGAAGGCLMFRDTDDAGWTECNALNGTLTCSVDADGICDGS